MKDRSKRVAFLGCCTGLALILAYVEVLLPPLLSAVPGVKLGLPNIAIIFVLYRFGVWDAAAVSFVRIVIASVLFGNPMTFAYSVAGALLSLTAMALLKKLNFLTSVGVSVAGGVLHNVGQIIMAMIMLGTAELGYYLIVLALTGTVSGILIGLCAGVAVKRVPKIK